MFNIRIGGEAGQGMNTIGTLLAKSLLRMGYHVFTSKDYMSRIRGGHNFSDIRFGSKPLQSGTEKVDILLALNKETWEIHKNSMTESGLLVYDPDDFSPEGDGPEKAGFPFLKKAEEIGDKRIAGVIALGLIHRIFDLSPDHLKKILSEKFSGEILEKNIKGLDLGYQEGEEKFSIKPNPDLKGTKLISGNDAIGFGALVAGVQFYSAYPMTPSTGVLNFLSAQGEKFKILVEQAEDEIAAINMALGASYGGVRAMTGTSGGGFSLMVEGLGLSGITETPLVILNGQRPGPATGLPTRTEQGDLEFVIHASQGEFPRIVLAPRDVFNAFSQTVRAFNLAEKYQLPVIILSDQFLGDSEQTISDFKPEDFKIDRGKLLKDYKEEKPYLRYRYTEDGISPRLIPGAKNQVVLVDSDEHNEAGNIIEDAETRTKMVEKRMKRMEKITEEMEPPLYKGPKPEKVELILVSWGSNFGPVEEARIGLEEEGIKVGHYSFVDIWPLPRGDWEKTLKEKEWALIENNFSGQLGSLLQKREIGYPEFFLKKYDGRPFTGDEIKRRIKEEVANRG